MTDSTPRVIFNINDQSIDSISPVEILPLDKQLYLAMTQKGKSGIHYYNSYALLEKEYGALTFKEGSPYYSLAAQFAKDVMSHNGIWFGRLIPPESAPAYTIMYVTVFPTIVTIYKKDPITGMRLTDNYGEWIPDWVNFETGAEGYEITISFENLIDVEDFDLDALEVKAIPSGDFIKYKYPIAVFKSKSPGVYGEGLGFELFYDGKNNSSDVVSRIKNILYTFKPKEKDFSTGVVKSLRDNYGAVENTFSFNNDAVNETLNMNVGINNMIETRYTDLYELPITVKVYEDFFFQMMDSIKDTCLTPDEKLSIGSIVNDPDFYAIDVIGGINPFTGIEYDLISVMNPDARKNHTNYLDRGSDGMKTREMELLMVQAALNFDVYPELEDAARYPITAIVDPGYDLTTKYSMIDFMSKREDVCVIISTFQSKVPPPADDLSAPKDIILDEAEDLAVGQALYTRMLLGQESILYGVEACRGAIVTQCGVPNTSIKNTTMPCTLWVAKRLAENYNKTYINSSLIKYPNSINSLFKDLNWYPVRLDFKNKLWGGGLNYCQFYDKSQLHYPAFRSVYPYETSKLIDFEFVYICCFIKQIAREIGMQYTGSDEAASIRHFKIQNSISNAINNMLNGKYAFEVSVGQTVDEATAGYIDHVYIKMAPDQAMTVLKVDLVVQNPNS